MHLAWSLFDETKFATVGKDHLFLCTIGDSIKRDNGSAKTSMSSVAWSQDSNYKTVMFSGGSDGKIYQWKNSSAGKGV